MPAAFPSLSNCLGDLANFGAAPASEARLTEVMEIAAAGAVVLRDALLPVVTATPTASQATPSPAGGPGVVALPVCCGHGLFVPVCALAADRPPARLGSRPGAAV